MYFVYVIQSESSNKIYIGQTNNLQKRLKQHNDRNFDKRSFTKLSGSYWKVIYKEEYQTRKEAIQREGMLKTFRGREFIRKKMVGL